MSYLKEVRHPPDYTKFTVKLILWALYYLKHYPLRMTVSRIFGLNEPTFNKYVWYVIELISGINNVSD